MQNVIKLNELSFSFFAYIILYSYFPQALKLRRMKNLALNYTKQSRSLFCLVLQQMVSKPGEFFLRLIHKIGKVKMIEFGCLL